MARPLPTLSVAETFALASVHMRRLWQIDCYQQTLKKSSWVLAKDSQSSVRVLTALQHALHMQKSVHMWKIIEKRRRMMQNIFEWQQHLCEETFMLEKQIPSHKGFLILIVFAAIMFNCLINVFKGQDGWNGPFSSPYILYSPLPIASIESGK